MGSRTTISVRKTNRTISRNRGGWWSLPKVEREEAWLKRGYDADVFRRTSGANRPFVGMGVEMEAGVGMVSMAW